MAEDDDALVTDQDTVAADAPDAPTREEYDALRTAAAKSEELLMRLSRSLTDPDVAEVIRAKEEGKAIRLTVGGRPDVEADASMALPSDVDLDAMSPSQLVKELLRQLPSVVAEGVKPLGDAVDGLAAERQTERKASVKREAEGLVEKYPDFLTYRDQIKQLVAENGLKLEEAYVMARLRDGKGVPTAKRPPSAERPSGMEVTFRGGAEPRRRDTARMGARGFQDMIAEALDNMVINADGVSADRW